MLQVSGLFVVVATAVGCLYFFDFTGVASRAGLVAVGGLLAVLNAAWVAIMIGLIVKAGLPSARQAVTSAFGGLTSVVAKRTTSQQVLMSGRSGTLSTSSST